MVIGEGTRADNIDPAGSQRPEEPVRIADPGKGQDTFASQCRHGFLVLQLFQSIERSLDYVVRIGCADRLGQHILNAC